MPVKEALVFLQAFTEAEAWY